LTDWVAEAKILKRSGEGERDREAENYIIPVDKKLVTF
jgi:hypothetical protein